MLYKCVEIVLTDKYCELYSKVQWISHIESAYAKADILL